MRSLPLLLVAGLLLASLGCKTRSGGGFLPPVPMMDAGDQNDAGDDGGNLPVSAGFGTVNGGVNGVMFGPIVDTYFGAAAIGGGSASIAIVQLSQQSDGCNRAGQAVGTDWSALQITVVNNGGGTISPGAFPVQAPTVPAGMRPTQYATVSILSRTLGGGITSTEATGGTVNISMIGVAASKRYAGTFAATFELGNHSGSFDTTQYCENLEVNE